MNLIQSDEENLIKGFRTEPKKLSRDFLSSKQNRKPLSGVNKKNDNVAVSVESIKKVTLSEPLNLSKSRSRLIQVDSLNDGIQKVSRPKKRPTNLNAAKLAKILEHDTFIEDELGPDESNELILFNFLEREGRLSTEILKAFSKCSLIKNINMTSSYAGIIGESGLLSGGKYSAALSTKSFYNGFQQILSLDFTNVKLNDDELRYLIRLPKLQALGLSGTTITDKGIKYLTVHSAFRTSLRCLKLCFIQGISDSSIHSLKIFTKLKSLDLRGCENITLSGCHDFVDETLKLPLTRLKMKLPEKIQNQLLYLSEAYTAAARINNDIIMDPNNVRIDNLTVSEVKAQLKIHKQFYPNVYLNEDHIDLCEKLIFILRTRKKEEILLQYCFN